MMLHSATVSGLVQSSVTVTPNWPDISYKTERNICFVCLGDDTDLILIASLCTPYLSRPLLVVVRVVAESKDLLSLVVKSIKPFVLESGSLESRCLGRVGRLVPFLICRRSHIIGILS